jgi:cobalamin biosynthesis protein CobT
MNEMNEMNEMIETNNMYGDSDFLAHHDLAVSDFRASEKDTKRKIIEKMLELRHNMKYNKHLLSVYMKAKSLFDTMVEEHRAQLYYLEEIYRHINNLIRENLSTMPKTKGASGVISELVKDKKRIGKLLKKMRTSYEKLTNADTVIGVTIDKMNEITFMDDDDREQDYDDEDISDVNEEEMNENEIESEEDENTSETEEEEYDEEDDDSSELEEDEEEEDDAIESEEENNEDAIDSEEDNDEDEPKNNEAVILLY